MSEFSENYHLRADSKQPAIDLLGRAQTGGFVYPPQSGWVALLCEGMFLLPNRALIEANQGVLLHYQVEEDHGWGFELYDKDVLVSRYLLKSDPTFSIDDSELNLDRLAEYVGPWIGDHDARPELKALLQPETDLELFGFQGHADGFGRLLGLNNFQWLSHQEFLLQFDPDDPDFAEIDVVK